MKINIKCPVCQAGNEVTAASYSCRRCNENLSTLYRIKAYSFKYRLFLAQLLLRKDEEAMKQKKSLASTASWLVKT